jgi:hypothetical protein
MGQPVYRYYSALDSGAQSPINLDRLPITQTLIAVWCADAGSTYSIEATLDDLVTAAEGGAQVSSPDPKWFPLAAFPEGTMGSKYAAIYEPWLFLRINIALALGNIELKVQQAWNSGFRG